MPTPLTVSHPQIAEQWHPTRNGDFTPDKTSAGSSKSVWWLCPIKCEHGCLHEWKNTVSNRCHEGWGGCPFCSKLQKKVCIHSSIVGTHPAEAAQWHPTKNGDRKAEQYSYGSEKKAWWLCPNTCSHGCPHEWEADISKRILRGSDAGCPFCATNHKQVCIHDSFAGKSPDLMKQWHPTKNEEIDPYKISERSSQNVWWLCENTCGYGCLHEWRARLSDRYGGTGCPFCCSNRQQICEHQSIVYTHPKILCDWHPTKNGALDPKTIPSGSTSRIWWKCQVNSKHEWQTAVNNRTGNKTGCPHCLNKTEEKLYKYLLAQHYDVVRRFTLENCRNINPLPFDLCIVDKKIIIEIDGDQHFKDIRNWLPSEETLRRDIFKMKKAEEEGYKVIRIYQIDAFAATDEWLDSELITEIDSEDRDHMLIATKPDLYDKHLALYMSGEEVRI